MNMKIITVLGTRPEIIKFSPLIPLLDKEFEHRIIHTGQHYNYEMDRVFFEDLELREPDYMLNVGSSTHAVQTAKMMVGTEEILLEYRPDMVIVLGDPNTPLAAALAAVKLNIPVAHLEAGCRSFNRRMPEEINRTIIDHCSEILFTPDETSTKNLISENIPEKKIFMVGSTVVDACLRNIELAKKSDIQERLGVKPDEYIVLTLHRSENTDDLKVLSGILSAVNRLSKETKVIFPIHPRTQKIIGDREMIDKSVTKIEPVGYLDFLKLLGGAKFVITDSGGIQEEADVINVPCVIARNETEWTELVDAGKNILASTDAERLYTKSSELLRDPSKLKKIKSIGMIRKPGASEKVMGVIRNYGK